MNPPTTRQPVVADIPPWGVVVFESHHAKGFRMGVSRHAWMEVFYVLEGSGAFELDGRDVACATGDVVVVPAGCGHRIQDNPARPLAMYGLRIRPDVWDHAPGLATLLHGGRARRNRLISLQVRAQFRQLLFEQTFVRPGAEAMMVGLTLQLLAVLTRSQGGPHRTEGGDAHRRSTLRQTVEAYAADLDHRFLESAKMDNVVAELGMSRRRFTALFREVTGATWLHYVRRRRVNHARELLRSTPKSVLSVAFESGFEDLSSFYRAFHREEKVSPQRWRERQH